METISRQLATIMFSDIAGYSSLMSKDEQRAIRLRLESESIIKDLVPKYDGEIIQFYGDGAVIMFDSNVEAIQCALEIQKAMSQIEGIDLRIGIHAGDVVMDDHNVYGECVNMASRIESFCTPGAVMFSDRVCEDIRNHPEIQTTFLGDFAMKNIPQPIALYALLHDQLVVPDPFTISGKGKANQSTIAVLPFVNMSTDPENEFFSDGISEEILNVLSKEEALRVTARTSSFAYKGKNKDIREIGRELNVETVLEGSVRKAGTRVRITAQLINTVNGFHLFSESFDRTLDDIFAVQDEIASKITTLLQSKLGIKKEKKTIQSPEPTENLDAYQDYLKGHYYWNKFSPEGAQKAIYYLQMAIDKDPDYAVAYSFLSFCYSFLGGTGQIPDEEAFMHADFAAEKALTLQPELVEAHCAKGLVFLFNEWNFVKGEESFNRAKAINRQSDVFVFTYGIFLKAAGRYTEAVAILEEGIVIDPNSRIAHLYLADAYMCNHQYDRALRQINSTIELYPNYPMALVQKAWILAYKQNFQESLDISETAFRKEDPWLKDMILCTGYIKHKLNDREAVEKCLEQIIGLEKEIPGVNFRPEKILLHYFLDQHDQAIILLNQGLDHGKGGMIMAYEHPFWLKIFKHPKIKPLKEVWDTKVLK